MKTCIGHNSVTIHPIQLYSFTNVLLFVYSFHGHPSIQHIFPIWLWPNSPKWSKLGIFGHIWSCGYSLFGCTYSHAGYQWKAHTKTNKPVKKSS